MVLLNLILNRCRRTAFLNSGRDASFVMAGGRQFHSFPTLCRKREEEIRPWVLNKLRLGWFQGVVKVLYDSLVTTCT